MDRKIIQLITQQKIFTDSRNAFLFTVVCQWHPVAAVGGGRLRHSESLPQLLTSEIRFQRPEFKHVRVAKFLGPSLRSAIPASRDLSIVSSILISDPKSPRELETFRVFPTTLASFLLQHRLPCTETSLK
jgi:hypothetical protein